MTETSSLVDEIHEKSFGPIVYDQNRDDFHVTMRKKDEVILTDEQEVRLAESAFEALRICAEIDPRFSKNVPLKVRNWELGYMHTNFSTSRQMIEDESSAQSAAIVHELVHAFEDDRYLAGEKDWQRDSEALPILAEILFTSQERLERKANPNLAKGEQVRYGVAKNQVVAYLSRELNSEKGDKFELYNIARNLKEEEKIKLIQKAINTDMGLKQY